MAVEVLRFWEDREFAGKIIKELEEHYKRHYTEYGYSVLFVDNSKGKILVLGQKTLRDMGLVSAIKYFLQGRYGDLQVFEFKKNPLYIRAFLQNIEMNVGSIEEDLFDPEKIGAITYSLDHNPEILFPNIKVIFDYDDYDPFDEYDD